jgi:hypothetical protein
MGISEFEKAVQLIQASRYDEAERYLNEALLIVKKASQEQTQGYLHLLNRLA